MNTILSIPIQYNGLEYYGLVRFIPGNNCMQVRVTIMNGAIEKLLCGNNMFEYRNGLIVDDVQNGSKETVELRRAVKDALQKHIPNSSLVEAGIYM
jgi:hypothetical protein